MYTSTNNAGGGKRGSVPELILWPSPVCHDMYIPELIQINTKGRKMEGESKELQSQEEPKETKHEYDVVS